MTVRTRLDKIAAQKRLRESTRLSYLRLLGRLDLLDRKRSEITEQEVTSLLYDRIRNPNTRRAAAIAVRSVLGYQIKIPKGIRRVYNLPDENTLRAALRHSPHEIRGLLMMYGGLRVGEACAVTKESLRGDRLMVDVQVQQLHRTGHPTITTIGPVKTEACDVAIPHWLAQRIATLTETVKPELGAGVAGPCRPEGGHQVEPAPVAALLREPPAGTRCVPAAGPASVAALRHQRAPPSTSSTIHQRGRRAAAGWRRSRRAAAGRNRLNPVRGA